MTLLTMVRAAARKLRLPLPDAVVSSTDPNVYALWELANEEGNELSTEYKWQELRRIHTWTSTATETQADGLPADFSRIIPDTAYNRSKTRYVRGPLTDQEWQVEKSLVSSSVVDAFYIINNALLVSPTPTAGETYSFTYETDYWCEDSAGTGQTSLLADSDVVRLPEHLFVLGIEWRWRRDRGLEWQPKYAIYQQAVKKRAASTGGRRVKDLGGGRPMGSMGVIVQDGNWPLT